MDCKSTHVSLSLTRRSNFEVGGWYNRPCVKILYLGVPQWVPVLGPSHTEPEPEIRVLKKGVVSECQQHYHVDKRFLGDDWAIRPEIIIADEVVEDGTQPFVFYQSWRARSFNSNVIEIIEKSLQEKCKTKLINGRCPHNGGNVLEAPIITYMGVGYQQCPNHGVAFRVDDGEMILNKETWRLWGEATFKERYDLSE